MTRPTLSQDIAAIRKLTGEPVVMLTLTPGWCLAGVSVRIRYRGRGRLRRMHIGSGARTQASAVRKLRREIERARGSK